jgi:hybrid cluster-associated redox disulfide protein
LSTESKKGGFVMENIHKTTLIGEIVNKYPEAVDVLLEAGMHCLGCPASLAESLEDDCLVHGIDTQPVLDALNARISE